jgi:hypothetical protein
VLSGNGRPDEIDPMVPLILAARYLRVPPWELINQPTYYRDWALLIRGTEQLIEAEATRG